VREGRENRKKSTAPAPTAEHATDEGLRSVKKALFLTYTVIKSPFNGTAAQRDESGTCGASPLPVSPPSIP